MNYYLYIDSKVQGPYTIDELFKVTKATPLPMSTLGRGEGPGNWVEISQIFSQHEKYKNQLLSLGSESQQNAETTHAGQGKKTTVAQINHVHTPWFVNLHYAFGSLGFIGALFSYIAAVGGGDAKAIQGVVYGLSLGVTLFIAGILLAWLHECVVRLRNIELNTAKAVEKLDK